MLADTNAALSALHDFFCAVSAEWAAPHNTERANASTDAHDKVQALLGEGCTLSDAIAPFRVPDAPTPDLAELWDLALKAPRGRWLYRPDRFDDWGVIRSDADGGEPRSIVGMIRTPPATERQMDEHRTAKTDPFGDAARFVAAAYPDAILGLLARHAAFTALLVEAARTFRFYEQNHLAKGPGQEAKAQRNAEIATRIEGALGVTGEIEAAIAVEAAVDGGVSASDHDLIERLRHTLVTMVNDDFSEPQTAKRRRLLERVCTIDRAMGEIGALRQALKAAASSPANVALARKVLEGALRHWTARREISDRAGEANPVATAMLVELANLGSALNAELPAAPATDAASFRAGLERAVAILKEGKEVRNPDDERRSTIMVDFGSVDEAAERILAAAPAEPCEGAELGIVAALLRLEGACEKLARGRPQSVYDAMIAAGQGDAMFALDEARRHARTFLLPSRLPMVVSATPLGSALAFVRVGATKYEKGYLLEELASQGLILVPDAQPAEAVPPTQGDAAAERRHILETELQECADGANGEGPFARGRAREALANLRAAAPAPPESGGAAAGVLSEIAAERRRQITNGWTAEHDDGHRNGEIVSAPWGANRRASDGAVFSMAPHTAQYGRKRLLEAAALIVAEIERLDRLAAAPAAARGDEP